MDYCSKLYQQQTGSVQWRQHDDVIKLFRQSSEGYMQYIPRGTNEQIVVCKFAQIRNESVLALASKSGRLELHDTKNKRILFSFWAMGGPIYDVAWIPGKLQVVVPSKHSKVKLWDASGPKVLEIFDFMECGDRYRDSKEPVTSIDTCREDPHVFATGGMDNVIILWDTRVQSKIGAIYKAHRRKNILLRRTVAGLAFRDRNSIVSCGENDESIKMWDYRSLRHNHATGETKSRLSFTYKGELSGTTGIGFSSVVIDDTRRMFANCTDEQIYCYNISKSCPPEPMMRYTDFRTDVSVLPPTVNSHSRLALSKDGTYIISGCNRKSAYIWNTDFSFPIARLNHTTPVTYVAWHQASDLDHIVVTCSVSKSRAIWRTSLNNSEEELLHREAPYSNVDFFPPVPHQLRLKDMGNFVNKSVRACRKCFNASLEPQCKKCKAALRLRNCCLDMWGL